MCFGEFSQAKIFTSTNEDRAWEREAWDENRLYIAISSEFIVCVI